MIDLGGDKANCGHPNPVWVVPDELWNRVIGTPENPRGEGIILCPACFLAKAER